jgi:transcriptional regulator with XRE-family HTH domain
MKKSSLYQSFQAQLRQMSRDGMTNREIAEKAGMSQSYVNQLLNGDAEQFGKVRIDMLIDLFPDVFRQLVVVNGDNHGAAIVNGDATINEAQGGNNPALMKAIIDDDTICDKCKIKVLKMLAK